MEKVLKIVKTEEIKVVTVDLGNLYSLFVRKEYAEWDSYIELPFYDNLEQLEEQYLTIKTTINELKNLDLPINGEVKEKCKDCIIVYKQMKDLFINQNVDRIELYCGI